MNVFSHSLQPLLFLLTPWRKRRLLSSIWKGRLVFKQLKVVAFSNSVWDASHEFMLLALVHAGTTLSQEEWGTAKTDFKMKWFCGYPVFIQQTLLLAPLLSECILCMLWTLFCFFSWRWSTALNCVSFHMEDCNFVKTCGFGFPLTFPKILS